jgi:hypothetical protein
MFKPGDIVRSVHYLDVNNPFLQILMPDGVYRGVQQYRCYVLDDRKLRFPMWRSERQLRKTERDSKVYDE